ncbi:hypothetical protein JOF56_010882 [Kibdelosporangium banguiense]|uniref:Prenyltransferase and squalene oxidase repeat-containing protein n=1 Tax=Kibdelosporangium banguiense TaxID=1365924 RepID=A0ABS4U1G5_9PSEU|nr:hypothetical protein [Kibdelosporangium banguiense]MBP2330497.1 hypothetical protein [Kibdelosporangium banguiense]
MTPVYLPSQHASVHDLPDDPESLRAALADAVATVIARQSPDGNFEDPAADDDVGDMSLGVVSLLCLAWHRGDRRDTELVAAARRGLDFVLAHRIFRTDNPGELFYRIRDSGLPYARYVLAAGEHPFGDWPSTVWAMLHAVNVLELGQGLCTRSQYAELTEVTRGFWHWLTEASLFNPQQTANQAIGAVAAGLALGRLLADQSIVDKAMSLYHNEVRAACVTDRGFRLPVEHGAGHDQNYLPISLTFLARAYQISGQECFLQDGDEIARHLECRLSARGFDYGGPRYSEQHCGCEGMLGLRFFGNRIEADLGRYLGDRRVAYYCATTPGVPSGHFAFTTVWFYQDDHKWYRHPADDPVSTPYSLRHGRVSVSLTEQLTPYLIDAAGTAVIESVVDHQHGIGPLVRYPDGESLLLVRPLGPVRTRDVAITGLAGKLVTKPVVTRDQVMLAVQHLYVSDGDRMYVVAVLDRSALPADVDLTFLAGLPYAAEEGERQHKILTVSEPDATPFDLGSPGEVLATKGILLAGGLAISGSAPLRVVNPPAGREYVNSPETIGLTQEQVAFALGDDPRGYGNPDHGWHRVAQTNHVLADPIPETPHGRAVFALCYGPDPNPIALTAEAIEEGVLVRAPGFVALIGHPAGDEHGDPILLLSAR